MLAWLSFIPGIASVVKMVTETLTPFLTFLMETFVGWLKAMWFGARDMFDNYKSVIFVLSMCIFTALGTYYTTKPIIAEQAIAELRQDYKFIPRKNKLSYNGPEWFTNPLEWWK